MSDRDESNPKLPTGYSKVLEELNGHLDTSKVRVYESDLGFSYWTDIVQRGVTTSDPSIFFRDYHIDNREEAFSYGQLHFDGVVLILSGDTLSRREPVRFRRSYDGPKCVWRITNLFGDYQLRDITNEMGQGFDAIKHVTGIKGFVDRKQQERCIALIQTLLSHYVGVTRRVQNGEEADARVEFSDEILEKFETGAFIL